MRPVTCESSLKRVSEGGSVNFRRTRIGKAIAWILSILFALNGTSVFAACCAGMAGESEKSSCPMMAAPPKKSKASSKGPCACCCTPKGGSSKTGKKITPQQEENAAHVSLRSSLPTPSECAFSQKTLPSSSVIRRVVEKEANVLPPYTIFFVFSPHRLALNSTLSWRGPPDPFALQAFLRTSPRSPRAPPTLPLS